MAVGENSRGFDCELNQLLFSKKRRFFEKILKNIDVTQSYWLILKRFHTKNIK